MIEINDMLGKLHQVKYCTAQDIDTHYHSIIEFIPDQQAAEFKARMLTCVEAGTAFAMSDDTCYLYYLKEPERPNFAVGIALFGMGNPLKTAALFAAIFGTVDDKILFLRFQTHPGKFVSEYKSMLTITSIKRHDTYGDPLMIRVDKLKNKITEINNKRGNT